MRRSYEASAFALASAVVVSMLLWAGAPAAGLLLTVGLVACLVGMTVLMIGMTDPTHGEHGATRGRGHSSGHLRGA